MGTHKGAWLDDAGNVVFERPEAGRKLVAPGTDEDTAAAVLARYDTPETATEAPADVELAVSSDSLRKPRRRTKAED